MVITVWPKTTSWPWEVFVIYMYVLGSFKQIWKTSQEAPTTINITSKWKYYFSVCLLWVS